LHIIAKSQVMWKGGQGKEMEEIWKCREKEREWKGWEKYE